MNTCQECIRAKQLVVHEQYQGDCLGCVVRRLAYQTAEQREWYFDRLQHVAGYEARAEVVKLVQLERARIAALKHAPRGGKATT